MLGIAAGKGLSTLREPGLCFAVGDPASRGVTGGVPTRPFRLFQSIAGKFSSGARGELNCALSPQSWPAS